MEYLVPLVVLCHLSPREIDELTWMEFDALTDYIDEWLDNHRKG